ncbi:RNA polymerase sigma factor [Dinghuibacter silviterrae]|uniref:RNA polymerase sigma factor n=1 Tax=Dinghuibacter silviterrae TaxID=1539049 RepID=UPI0013C2D38F|nr:sigma-70 family RNA polymerase sigma factor [Dinghuibacter silviterrae]
MENTVQDIALWDSFKKGEPEAFRQLFRRYYPSLYLYGHKITPDKELLEDCIQDLFTELWLSPSKTPVQSVRAYLLKALQYKLLKSIQKRSKIQLGEDTPDTFQISHENFIILREHQEENGEKVKTAMEQLSPRQQEIVYLRFFQELSYEEISEVMHINYQVARNLLYQSIKALRKTLA